MTGAEDERAAEAPPFYQRIWFWLVVIGLLAVGRGLAEDLYGTPPGTPCEYTSKRSLFPLLHCQGRWFDGRCAEVHGQTYCTYMCSSDADCPAGWRCGHLISFTGAAYDDDHCVAPPGEAAPTVAPTRLPWDD